MKKIDISNLPGTANINDRTLDGMKKIASGGTFITKDYDEIIPMQKVLFRGMKVDGWNDSPCGLQKRYSTEDGKSWFVVNDVQYTNGETQFFEVYGILKEAHYKELLTSAF